MYSEVHSIAPEGGLSKYLLELNQDHMLNKILKPRAEALGFLRISEWTGKEKHDKFYDVFGHYDDLFFDMVRLKEPVVRDTDVTGIPKVRLKIYIDGKRDSLGNRIVASIHYADVNDGYEQESIHSNLRTFAKKYKWEKETSFLHGAMEKFDKMKFSDKPKGD